MIRLRTKLENSTPDSLWLQLAFVGGSVAGLSIMCGVGFLTQEGRQVGYIAALNWSLNFVIVVPMFAAAVRASARGTFAALAKLHKHKCVLRLNGKTAWVREPKATQYWQRIVADMWRNWVPACLVFGFTISVWEWLTGPCRALYYGDLHGLNRAQINFTVASLLPAGENVPRAVNAVFDLLPVVMQSLTIAALLMHCIVTAKFAGFLLAATKPTGVDDFRLRVDLSDSDGRTAATGLARWLTINLAACALAMLILYLSRLQDVYYWCEADVANICQFLLQMFRAGPFSSTIFSDVIDHSAATVLFGGVFIASTAVVLPIAILWDVAHRSQTAIQETVGTDHPEMVRWPLDKATLLFAALILCSVAGGLLAFQLSPVLIVAMLLIGPIILAKPIIPAMVGRIARIRLPAPVTTGLAMAVVALLALALPAKFGAFPNLPKYSAHLVLAVFLCGFLIHHIVTHRHRTWRRRLAHWLLASLVAANVSSPAIEFSQVEFNGRSESAKWLVKMTNEHPRAQWTFNVVVGIVVVILLRSKKQIPRPDVGDQTATNADNTPA